MQFKVKVGSKPFMEKVCESYGEACELARRLSEGKTFQKVTLHRFTDLGTCRPDQYVEKVGFHYLNGNRCNG